MHHRLFRKGRAEGTSHRRGEKSSRRERERGQTETRYCAASGRHVCSILVDCRSLTPLCALGTRTLRNTRTWYGLRPYVQDEPRKITGISRLTAALKERKRSKEREIRARRLLNHVSRKDLVEDLTSRRQKYIFDNPMLIHFYNL